MSRPRYWLAGALTACCLAIAANAQIVNQVVNSVAVGGITGLGTGVATWLATPSSSNLAATVTDETGSGALVFANTPTLVTPVLGAATATSINLGGSTLSNYVVGSWTPIDSSGASLTFVTANGGYTRIGNMVFAYATVAYPVTADGSTAIIGGLPITVANQLYARQCTVSYSDDTTLVRANAGQNATTLRFSTAAGANLTNVQMSASSVIFMCAYPAT
jgi:hypothetical protein